MRKLIQGFGVNDADYPISVTIGPGMRRHCPFYRKWFDMLKRCYSESYHSRFPAYAKCEVAHEWKYFMNFRRWMADQPYHGMELDKDILGDGRLYSPTTCCFVPAWLNSIARGQERKGTSFRLCYLGTLPPDKQQKIVKALKQAYVYARLDEVPLSAQLSLAIDRMFDA